MLPYIKIISIKDSVAGCLNYIGVSERKSRHDLQEQAVYQNFGVGNAAGS